jgi:hypothetical protein
LPTSATTGCRIAEVERCATCYAMQWGFIADGAEVADRPEIDSRASIQYLVTIAAVRVPDVPFDTTALRAPRPLTTRLYLLHWGPRMVSTVLLSCPIPSRTTKDRASGIIRLPATDGDVGEWSPQSNAWKESRARQSRVRDHFGQRLQSRRRYRTVSRVVPAVLNWGTWNLTTTNNMRRPSERRIIKSAAKTCRPSRQRRQTFRLTTQDRASAVRPWVKLQSSP